MEKKSLIVTENIQSVLTKQGHVTTDLLLGIRLAGIDWDSQCMEQAGNK